MPRPKRLRKIVAPPKFKGYKPYGETQTQTEPVELLYEEYEALKLSDYDLLKHNEAADLMGVSRATFARIYETARRKIALALVEVKEIKAKYGNACFDENWFECAECNSKFSIPKAAESTKCPLCKSLEINKITK